MLTSPTHAVPQRQSDRCKCGHAMLVHLARCCVPKCKCKQFSFKPK